MKNVPGFIAGFRDFQKKYFCSNHELFDRLKKRQSPTTMLISCCDSRVEPGALLGAEPGDLFITRNIAGLVPPYGPDKGLHGVSAALEYAVKFLKVENIIVLGHSNCGGIRALTSPAGGDEGEFITPWVRIARDALAKADERFPDREGEAHQRACELAAILVSLENLLTFPWIRERVDRDELHITGWYFDMQKGALLGYSAEERGFFPVVPKCT